MIPFNLCFIICIFAHFAYADLDTLIFKRNALQLEYDLVQSSPATYYIVIDFPSQELYLKADANLLRTCKINQSAGQIPHKTQLFTLQMHIEPYTPIASAQRLLPLDFSGRLTNGPKHRSQLYFTPPLLMQSAGLPKTTHIPTIQLSDQDIKALASALTTNNNAILIPNQTSPNELKK